MSKILSIILFGLIVFSCKDSNTSKAYLKINDFLSSKDVNINDYKSIVVINEKGTCLNCNNKFAKTMEQYINKDSVVFIISTTGTLVDISGYLEKENNKNIITDFSNEFLNLDLVDHCSIINLKNKDVDTIIQFDISNIEQVNLLMK